MMDSNDPFDRVRANDPVGSVDPELVARARSAAMDRIAAADGADLAPTLAVDLEPVRTERSNLFVMTLVAAVGLFAFGLGVGLRSLGSQDAVQSDAAGQETGLGDPLRAEVPDPTGGDDGEDDATEDDPESCDPDETPAGDDGDRDEGRDEDQTDPDSDPVMPADPNEPATDPVDPPPTVVPPVGSGQFFEDFAGNQGLDRLRIGVFHRNIGSQELGQSPDIWGDGNARGRHGGTWTGDHDLDCGPPPTQRSLNSDRTGSSEVDFNLEELVYSCKDHVMTSMGDVDGYSMLWFSPRAQFSRAEARTVSWDVNLTDLMGRQWWEVAIVPTGTGPLTTMNWMAGTAGLEPYHPDAIVVGNGPFGGTVSIVTDGENRYDGWRGVCDLDPEACDSKPIRRTFTVTDNGDGTITVDYGGFHSQTLSGSFPENFEVFFTDHNYTPNKDGVPVGHTWHWDNISIR